METWKWRKRRLMVRENVSKWEGERGAESNKGKKRYKELIW